MVVTTAQSRPEFTITGLVSQDSSRVGGHAQPGAFRPAMRAMSNPVEALPEALRAGMEHWADHCAVCHDNDGRGRTEVGRGLFPPVPDMQAPATQELSDGALFYSIEQGVPLTGMPAWSTGTEDGERASWELVLFIRHLPEITTEELADMEALNPRSAADLALEQEIDDFLSGGP